MQVPQVLLDRREELRSEYEAVYETLDAATRQAEMLLARAKEIDTAITAIEDAQAAVQASQPERIEPKDSHGHRCPTGHPGVSGHEAAEKQSTEKLRTRRPIREMILSELKHSPVSMTVKEIMHAVQASKQVVLKALNHHLETGKVTQIEGARWIAVKPEVFPIEFPRHSADDFVDSEITETVEPVEELYREVDEDAEGEDEYEEQPESEASETTKAKIVRLLSENNAHGLTDEELAAHGVPYLASMAYRDKGLLIIRDGRNFLNPEGESA